MIRCATISGEISFEEAKVLVRDGCEGTVWVDAVKPSEDELKALEETFNLHYLTVEDLQHKNQRAKVEAYDHYLFVVMHQQGEHEDPDELHCVVGKHFVLTVSDPCPLSSVQAAWARFTARVKRSPTTPDGVLYRLLDELTDAHRPQLEKLDDEVEELGHRVSQYDDTRQIVSELVATRRKIVKFKRIVGVERDVVLALARNDYEQLDEALDVYFRDVVDHLTRTYEALEALREHADLIAQEHFAINENRRSQVMKRLTIISTIFLPLNFITGFFGMNFTHLPFDSWTMLYIGLSAMIAVPGLFMTWLLLARWV